MFQSFKGIWQSLFIFKDFLINLFIIIDRFFFRGEINLKNFIYLPGPMSFRDAHRWFSIEIISYEVPELFFVLFFIRSDFLEAFNDLLSINSFNKFCMS